MPDIAHMDQLFLAKRRLDADAYARPEITARLSELRSWQAERLARTYADLSHDPRCATAVNFFLTDLYGPQDFTRRDDDFARAWSRLKRGLPDAALEVLARALELQVLSAELDQAMLQRLVAGPVTDLSYADAYRAVGRADARRRQIDLVMSIGTDLARLVSFPLIGLALRVAHAPAHLAGFGALQDFLERGYDAFRRMGDPGALLGAIQSRETTLMQRLFAGNGDPFA
ncbi:MAG TPA: hypothetical protein VI653_16280 [Steroidobacteraceae bacterium]